MQSVLVSVQTAFHYIVQVAILLLETIGVAVLLYTAVCSVVELFLHNERVKLNLAEGIGLALEFKLGSEVLRTLSVREWNELAILGAIIVLRAAITFLIQWEIGIELRNLGAHKPQ